MKYVSSYFDGRDFQTEGLYIKMVHATIWDVAGRDFQTEGDKLIITHISTIIKILFFVVIPSPQIYFRKYTIK